MFSLSSGTPKFSASGQGAGFNHQHAAAMGHASALRLQAARALSGRPTAPIIQPQGGASGVPGGTPPVQPVQPVQAVQPNYKVQIGQAMAARGKPVAVGHIHNAIDQLAQKGQFTPFQAQVLKQHNGPLVGPQGQQTGAMIMNQMLAKGGM